MNQKLYYGQITLQEADTNATTDVMELIQKKYPKDLIIRSLGFNKFIADSEAVIKINDINIQIGSNNSLEYKDLDQEIKTIEVDGPFYSTIDFTYIKGGK